MKGKYFATVIEPQFGQIELKEVEILTTYKDEGLVFLLHRSVENDDFWTVTEIETGAKIISHKNKAATLKALRDIIDEGIERIQKAKRQQLNYIQSIMKAEA